MVAFLPHSKKDSSFNDQRLVWNQIYYLCLKSDFMSSFQSESLFFAPFRLVVLLFLVVSAASQASSNAIYAPLPTVFTTCPQGEALLRYKVLSPEDLIRAYPTWHFHGEAYRSVRLPSGFNYNFDEDSSEHQLAVDIARTGVKDNFKVYSSVTRYLSGGREEIYTSPVMTIRLRQSNFGTPGQLNECSFPKASGEFVLGQDYIDQLRLAPGTLNNGLTIGCDAFDQVILLNAETGFFPLTQNIPGDLLVLIDGSSGPLVLSDTEIQVSKGIKFFLVGLPMDRDLSGSGSGASSGSGLAVSFPDFRPVIEFLSQKNLTWFSCDQATCYFENLAFNLKNPSPGSRLIQQQGGQLTVQNSVIQSNLPMSDSMIRQLQGQLNLLNTTVYSSGQAAPVESDRRVTICNSHFICSGSHCPLGLDLQPYSPKCPPVSVRFSSVSGFDNGISVRPVQSSGQVVPVTMEQVFLAGNGVGSGMKLGGQLDLSLSDMHIKQFHTGIEYLPQNRINLLNFNHIQLDENQVQISGELNDYNNSQPAESESLPVIVTTDVIEISGLTETSEITKTVEATDITETVKGSEGGHPSSSVRTGNHIIPLVIPFLLLVK